MHNNIRTLVTLALGATISANATAGNYWYDAPFGTSKTYTYVNNAWTSTNIADYSMPGAATGGNSFFVIKGSLSNNGMNARPSQIFQRVGTGTTAYWKPYGSLANLSRPETFTLRVPVKTAAGITVRAKTNLPKNWYYDVSTVTPFSFTVSPEWAFHGPYGAVPGTTLSLGQIKHYSGWAYMGDYSATNFALWNQTMYSGWNQSIALNKPTSIPTDMCVSTNKSAYAVDGSSTLWRITNTVSFATPNASVYTPIDSNVAAITPDMTPGGQYDSCNYTDYSGNLKYWTAAWGITNLGKPAGTAGIYSHTVNYPAGKEYIICAVDLGTGGIPNGKQRLYYRAFDWNPNIWTWLPWQPLPQLPAYTVSQVVNGAYKFLSVGRYIVGSPTLDAQAKKVVVMDQEGGYWRGGWNWNESAWLWENCGKP